MTGLVIGIDCGQLGGMAFLNDGVRADFVIPMRWSRATGYDYDTMHIEMRAADLVVIEQVTRPGKLVRNAATLEGICIGAGVPVKLVRPQEWRAWHGIKDGSGKAGAAKKLKELRPDLYEMALGHSGKSVRPQDGCVDAALIAIWGIEQEVG